MRRLLVPTLLLAVITIGCSATEAQAKAKCDGCGQEVEASTLASHDGMKLCEACMASHDH
jgi:hypothetical protein